MPKTQYLWDMENDSYLAELDGAGNVTAAFTCSPEHFGRVVSERRDGHTYHHHYDALGSTRALTDESGSVTDTFDYDAWGNEIDRTGATETPFRWNGECGSHFDSATGLYQIRSRQTEGETARWMSADPAPLQLITLDEAVNRYRIALDNPFMFRDPSGLSVQPDRIISSADACKRATIGNARVQELRKLGADPKIIRNFKVDVMKATAIKSAKKSLPGFLKNSPLIDRLYGTGFDRLKDPAFIQSLLRNEMELALLANSAEHWAGGRTDARNAFVFTCRCGWIDLGHFWASAVAGYSGGFSAAMAGGYLVEMVQLLGPGPRTWRESQFTIEDLPSDRFGSQFGQQLRGTNVKDLGKAFCDALKACEPVPFGPNGRPPQILVDEATRLRDDLIRSASGEVWRGEAFRMLCCTPGDADPRKSQNLV